ncbi:hypothetical protein I4U23_017081 [Adineta vaga]|nr:hypothetical protein I4U23_017081 [Adineta vaga]
MILQIVYMMKEPLPCIILILISAPLTYDFEGCCDSTNCILCTSHHNNIILSCQRDDAYNSFLIFFGTSCDPDKNNAGAGSCNPDDNKKKEPPQDDENNENNDPLIENLS